MRVVKDRQVARHRYRNAGEESIFVRHEKGEGPGRVTGCMEHLHLPGPGLFGFDTIPVDEFVIEMYRSTDDQCKTPAPASRGSGVPRPLSMPVRQGAPRFCSWLLSGLPGLPLYDRDASGSG